MKKVIDEKYIKEKYGRSVVVNNPKAIPPFMEVEDGFGYRGVLLEDETDETVMCHICGEWLGGITGNHIKKHYRAGETDVRNTKEYKEKYGFLKGTALLCSKAREKISESSSRPEQVKRLKKQVKKFHTEEHYAKLKKAAKKRKKYQRSAEMRNRWGSCQKQLIHRLQQFVNENERVPKQKEVSWGDSACRRFGSWGKFVGQLGLKPVNASNYSDSQLIGFIKEFVSREGKDPKWSDFRRKDLPSRGVYYYHFGSWKKALKMAKYEMS